MSNHKNLIFFNKEGDYLNFNYNNNEDRFEGDILFDENSSDTYKTFGLYTLENIPSFEFEEPNNLSLNKFQLFNEWGLNFYGSDSYNHYITGIEPINNDSTFYSKWIYGDNFEKLFKIGSLISFNTTFLEFTDTKRTYTVVSSKINAIMIISSIDNASFESNYFTIYNNNTISNISISGVNTVGVYNYIDSSYQNNISKWSEPNFYDKFYTGKKLNVVGSDKNDGVLTVLDSNLTDLVHFEYWVTNIQSDLIIEVATKTDLPKIYDDGLIIENGVIKFVDGQNLTSNRTIPQILKPGTEFNIVGSNLNTNFLMVSTIPTWIGNTQQTFYATQSQILYNNLIYECVLSHTQSFGSTNSLYINPTNTTYWSRPTYIRVDQQTTNESLQKSQIYLTTDKIYFGYGYTQSSEVTLASTAEFYHDDLKAFNVDLYYENGILKADSIYSSKYVEVNFYKDSINPLNQIGNTFKTNERIIKVKEVINYELNNNISENFKYNLTFNDLDEYGFKVIINNEVYEEETSLVYSGSNVDMDRTIDRTLRNWISRNYIRLNLIGINTELKYIGNVGSPFFNSIIIKTEYPNVPLNINRVEVGTTADFHIEHSTILFNELGSLLSISINNKDYTQSTIYDEYLTSSPYKVSDISGTLQSWVDQHKDELFSYGFIVKNINNLLKFDINRTDIPLTYKIKTGKISIPGKNDYIITNRIKGNLGSLISSNEVNLINGSTSSFEESGFATGMILSINNTEYPLNNQEYNIQFLDNEVLNLSYQGPFWGSETSLCKTSPYITLAFDYGFGQTGCGLTTGITGSGGAFDLLMFDNTMVSIYYNTTTYDINNYTLSNILGSDNMVDLLYVQISNSIYILGDSLIQMDSFNYQYLKTINLPSNTNSIKLLYNDYNNYIYCLSETKLYVIDPLLNILITTISLSNTAYDMTINSDNGDIYITYSDSSRVEIYNSINTIISTIITPNITGKLIYNTIEESIYVTVDNNTIIKINGTYRNISATYTLPNLELDFIYFNNTNNTIYIYSSTYLYSLSSGVLTQTQINRTTFNDVLFNTRSGEMNISGDNNDFNSLDNDGSITLTSDLSMYGYMTLNLYDNNIYLTSQVLNTISVINTSNGFVVNTESIGTKATKSIYNPDRKSVWAIQPTSNSIVEILPDIDVTYSIPELNGSTIDEQRYGILDDNYQQKTDIWIKSREYVRRPRENFETDTRVNYYWKWISDENPEFFIYDLSGEQLDKSGSYAYIGEKPLLDVPLNKNKNKDLSKVSSPQHQQTVFDVVVEELSYIDDSTDISVEPEPIQLFLGFKSNSEGTSKSILQLYKSEDISFSISSSSTNDTILSFETLEDNVDKRGLITINPSSDFTFSNKGLKVGQTIVTYIEDISNLKDQYISENNGSLFKIRNIYTKSLVLEFFNKEIDSIHKEDTFITSSNTYLKTTIKVIDREIGRFNTYGQTEVEDDRYRIELSNVGKIISQNEVFIFNNYDILEGGVDWNFLNIKRKELILMQNLIYPFIGSYKSIINAINFFGYNDLQLNEYYRNVDNTSKNFSKLFKVEIPDIFDNTIDGWNESDFLKHTLPNDKFEETNLLNLTYNITDKDGTNLLGYSLDDITIKLQGLKFWLKRNIIPLTHKILDITGKSYFKDGIQITHKVNDIRIINIKENITPIKFRLNEAYLLPVNSGSTVYNCVLDFFTINDTSTNNDDIINNITKPFNGVDLTLPDYFNIKIRTYKTFKEWEPFTTYKKGDKISYYERLYESTIVSNKVNNPKKYEESLKWNTNFEYKTSTVVEYDRDYYSYTGLGSTSILNPLLDTTNWINVTEWKEVNYEPVQTISEYRIISKSEKILPYNFTIDSNIDPFVSIEVTCDNGYGSTYQDRKNYEIRGLKDLSNITKSIENNGPFKPIIRL